MKFNQQNYFDLKKYNFPFFTVRHEIKPIIHYITSMCVNCIVCLLNVSHRIEEFWISLSSLFLMSGISPPIPSPSASSSSSAQLLLQYWPSLLRAPLRWGRTLRKESFQLRPQQATLARIENTVTINENGCCTFILLREFLHFLFITKLNTSRYL